MALVGRLLKNLAEEGKLVVISDINRDQGISAAVDIDGKFIYSDLREPEACSALINEAANVYGSIDILINNAGIQYVSSIEEFPEDKWTIMLQLMLTSPFLLTKYVWPYMKNKTLGAHC